MFWWALVHIKLVGLYGIIILYFHINNNSILWCHGKFLSILGVQIVLIILKGFLPLYSMMQGIPKVKLSYAITWRNYFINIYGISFESGPFTYHYHNLLRRILTVVFHIFVVLLPLYFVLYDTHRNYRIIHEFSGNNNILNTFLVLTYAN